MDKKDTQGSEAVVVEVEQTDAQRKAEEAEGEAAFAAGVANVRGAEAQHDATAAPAAKVEDKDAAATEAAAKATAETEAKVKAEEATKAAAAAAADPWKDVPPVMRDAFTKLNADISSQISKLAGHVGGFKRTLEGITATATAAAEKKGEAAPSKIDIAEALTDPDKWKQLQEDFPEWMQPVAAELTRLRKEMAAVAKSAEAKATVVAQPAVAAEPVNTAAIVAEAEERAYVRLKHPDWKAICASPEFAKDWLPKQTDAIKTKAASESADDAIAVFDAYKAHQKKTADEAAAKARNEKRLQTAVPAQGAAEPPAAGISDEEAFNKGVKTTLRKAS